MASSVYNTRVGGKGSGVYVQPVSGAASGIVLANGDTVEQELGATKRQANLATDLASTGTIDAALTPNSKARSYVDSRKDCPNWMDYISAQADRNAIRARTNTTDFTTAIQVGLDEWGSLGGGEFALPSGAIYCAGLILPDRVSLRGQGMPNTFADKYGTCLVAPAADNTGVISDPATGSPKHMQISNLGIFGNTAYSQRGVYLRNSQWFTLDRVFISGMQQEALRCEVGGKFPQLRSCRLFGAQVAGTPALTDMGGVFFDTSEFFVNMCEFGAGLYYTAASIASLGHNPTDAELWHKALFLGPNAGDGKVLSSILEGGCVGLHNQGSGNSFPGTTADGNGGHGHMNKKSASAAANYNQWQGCRASRNSRYATGVYDGINFADSTSVGNQVIGLVVTSGLWPAGGEFSGITPDHRYGVYDGGPDSGNNTDGNQVLGISGATFGIAPYGQATAAKGGYTSLKRSTDVISTTGSITLDAKRSSRFRLSAAAEATTVTGIVNGADGDVVYVSTVNPQLFTHSVNFRLPAGSGIGFKSQAWEELVFRNDEGTWVYAGGSLARKQQDSAANLQSATAAINTTGKYESKEVWDFTNHRNLWAAGATAVSPWKDGAGTVVYTPV
jgi:hypothetical protein